MDGLGSRAYAAKTPSVNVMVKRWFKMLFVDGWVTDKKIRQDLDKMGVKSYFISTPKFNKFVSYHFYLGGFWVRIFGLLIQGADCTRTIKLFSERYGFTKFWHIGKWKFRICRQKNRGV